MIFKHPTTSNFRLEYEDEEENEDDLSSRNPHCLKRA